MDLKNKNC